MNKTLCFWPSNSTADAISYLCWDSIFKIIGYQLFFYQQFNSFPPIFSTRDERQEMGDPNPEQFFIESLKEAQKRNFDLVIKALKALADEQD